MSEKNQENEKENIVVDAKGEKIKTKKMNFFKKVRYSITKFEKYIEMSAEGIGRALKYILQITSIFVLIIALIGIFDANKGLNGFIKNIEDNAPDFKYTEGQLTLVDSEENKVYTIQDTDFNFGKIIVDLNTEDQNIITEHENTIKSDSKTNNAGIIFLKDKVMQVAKLPEGVEGETTISMTYDELVEGLFGSKDVEITKSNLIEFLNGNGRTNVLIINFTSYFIAYFIIYILSALIYTILLGIIGFAAAKVTKMKLTFKQLFAISAYAFTLSNILNMIYFTVNYFWGITIKYFDIAYIAIAYIYLIVVMFLIKFDSAKKKENQVKEEKEEKKETDGQEQI